MAIIDLTPPAFLTDDPKKKKKQKGNQKGFVIDLSALENIPKPLKAPKSLNTTGEEAPKAKMVIAEDRPQTDTPMTDFLETFVPPPPKEQDMGMIKPDVYKAPSFNAEDIERANQIESDGRLGTMQSLQNVMNPVAVLQQLDPKTIKQKTSNLKDYAENFKLLLTGKPESVIQWAATNPIMTSMVDKWEDANNANTLAKQTYDPQLRTLADAKQISALANTLFTPISLAFDVLGNIPVVGEPIVDVVMRNFNTASAITQLITPTLNIFDNDKYNKEFQGILNEVIPIVALGFEGFAKKKGLSKKITPENINEVQAEYKVIAEKLAEDIRLDYDKYRKDPASTSAEFINKQLQLTQGEPYTKADWSVDVDGRITKGKQKPETLDIKEYKEPPKMLPESDVKPEQPPKQLTQGEVFTPADYIVDADGRVIKPKSETSKPVIYNPFDKSVQMPEQLPKDLTYNKADFVTDESGVTRQGKPAFEPIDIKSYNKPKGLLPEITDLTTDITTHQEVKANLDRASKDIANVLAIEKSDDLKYIYNKFKDGELDKILNGEKEPPITHGIIKRLESNGLLEPEWLDLAVKDNNYNITDKGKEVIKKIEQRLFDLKAVKRGESLMPEQMGIPEIKLTKKEQIRYSEYQKAKQSFKEKTQGRMNMTFGLDAIPEAITIGKYHISKGLKKFADWSKQMLRELGRVVKPHLRTIWEKVNKGIISEESFTKAKESFKKLPNKLASNPADWYANQFKNLSIIGSYYVEKGVRRFPEWSKKMVEEVGEGIRPHLRDLYIKINQDKELGYIATTPPMGEKKSTTPGYNKNTMGDEYKDIMPEVIESFRKEFDEMRGNRITNKQTLESAIKKAQTLTDNDILNLKRGEIRNSVDATAMRIYTHNRLVEFQKKNSLKDVKLSETLENAPVEVKMFLKVESIYGEAGRTLQTKSINAKEMNATIKNIIDKYDTALKDVDTNKLKTEIAALQEELKTAKPEDKPAIEKQIEDKQRILDTADLVEAVRDVIDNPPDLDNPKGLEKAKQLFRYIYYNVILSNPLTDTANITGNSFSVGFEIFQNILSGKDGMTYVKGLKKGFSNGIQAAKEVARYERINTDKLWEGRRYKFVPKTKTGKVLANVFLATQRLGIEDAFFKELSKGAEGEVYKSKIAKEKGITIDGVEKLFNDIMKDPDLANPEHVKYLKTIKAIDEYGYYTTFNTELKSKIGKGLQQVSTSTVGMPFLPFVRTPGNLLKASFNTTPLKLLQFASKEKREWYKNLNQREKGNINRRILAGTILYTGIGALMANGLVEITGSGPDDYDKKMMWESIGYKPYHIYLKTGGKRKGISYQNINPVNFILSAVGNMSDYYKYNYKPDDKLNSVQILSKSLLSIAENFTEQTYLSGVSRLFSSLKTGNPNYITDIAQGMAVPNIVSLPRDITRYAGGDDKMYETKSPYDKLLNKLGIRQDLKPQLNQFGQEKKITYERFPLPVSEVKGDEMLEWFIENNINISNASKQAQLGKEKMTDDQYYLYNKLRGEKLLKELSEQFDYIKSLPIDEARKRIRSITDTAGDKAKDEVKKQFGIEDDSDNPFKQPKLKKSDNPFKRR